MRLLGRAGLVCGSSGHGFLERVFLGLGVTMSPPGVDVGFVGVASGDRSLGVRSRV